MVQNRTHIMSVHLRSTPTPLDPLPSSSLKYTFYDLYYFCYHRETSMFKASTAHALTLYTPPPPTSLSCLFLEITLKASLEVSVLFHLFINQKKMAILSPSENTCTCLIGEAVSNQCRRKDCMVTISVHFE